MTKQEVFEYNKRCALFLGWKETTELFQINWVGCKTKERLDRLDNAYIPILEKNGDVIFSDFSVIEFTENWNRIMEVVEAIEKLGYEIDIFSNCVEICDTPDENYIGEAVGKTKKEAVVQAINQFLIWYNQGK